MSNDDIWSRLAGSLQQFGGSLQGGQQQPSDQQGSQPGVFGTLTGGLQAFGTSLQRAAQQQQTGQQPQSVNSGTFANALQKISRALQGGDQSQPATPAPSQGPPAQPATFWDGLAGGLHSFGQSMQNRGAAPGGPQQQPPEQKLNQQAAAHPAEAGGAFAGALQTMGQAFQQGMWRDPLELAAQQRQETRKRLNDDAFREVISAAQRPPATPEVIQKLLAEGRITPVEAQMGQTPSFADGRMNGFVMP